MRRMVKRAKIWRKKTENEQIQYYYNHFVADETIAVIGSLNGKYLVIRVMINVNRLVWQPFEN